MAWPASHWFTDSLIHSHTMLVRVDAWRGGERLPPDVIGADNYTQGLPVAAGSSITIDSASKVRRQLDLRLSDPRLNPRDPTSPLAPYGTELVVQYGIRYLGGSEFVPVGVFRLDEARGGILGGEVAITAPDRSRAIADAVFLVPRQSPVGLTIPAAIASLVREVLPGVEVLDQTGSHAVTPRAIWERDRWGAIETLATSIGAEVLFNPAGAFVIRPVPSPAALPSWWLQIGPSGTVVRGDSTISRIGVHNAVVARGERADDALPVYAVAYDDDPGSPTWWDGPFGQAPLIWESSLLTTTKQARDAASGLLERYRAQVRELTLDIVPQPLLEPGDVVAVQYQDYSVDRVMLTHCELPLSPGSMALTARSGQLRTEDEPAIAVPPSVSTSMQIGLFTAARDSRNQLQEFERMELESQRSMDIRRTDAVLTTWAAHPASADVGLRKSFAGIRSDPYRMSKGLDNDQLRAFIQAIPEDHTTYLCWWPGAEDPSHKFDPAVMRAAGSMFARMVKGNREDRTIWVTWMYAGRSFAPMTGRNPDAWYWGDKSVEVVATDGFNPYTNTYYGISAADQVGILQAHMYAHRHGRRFGVAALGNYDLPVPDRAKFLGTIKSWLSIQVYPKCEFAIWQHTSAKYGPYWLDTSGESMDAWRAAITL